MSAYIVEKNHIDYLVYVANTWGITKDPKEFGKTLWNENAKSVNWRYNDGQKVTYRTTNKMWLIDPVQVLKAVQCLDYQSCEHDGWETSLACRYLSYIQSEAISKLPGYDKAQWGAPEPI